MNYPTGRALNTVAGGPSQEGPAKVSTVNERMNRMANQLTAACQRVENMLSKVNGTPQHAPKDAVDKIAGINPLMHCLEQIENQVERLHRLTEGLEQIA